MRICRKLLVSIIKPRLIHQLKSSIISQYWDDVIKHAHQPEFYLKKRKQNQMNIAPLEIHKLIGQIIRTKREDGDIWPALLCKQFTEYYSLLDINQKANVLKILEEDFGVDHKSIEEAIKSYQGSRLKTGRSFLNVANRLRVSLEPAYDSLFNRISQLPDGMAFLVNLRADLLQLLHSKVSLEHPDHLYAIENHLKLKFQKWFGINHLELEQITWKSPANVLEKIVAYEAVHDISSWSALKQRLGPGRFCYSFFHPSMPHEPLTFVQVAVLDHLPLTIDSILLDPNPKSEGNTVAAFYSITSSQRGLAKVDLGNFLIKRVMKELQIMLPDIKTFYTLSPIPKFRNWLETSLNEEKERANIHSPKRNSQLFLQNEIDSLKALQPFPKDADSIKVFEVSSFNKYFVQKSQLLKPEVEKVLRPILTRLCSRYILLEKRRSFALDPVANFHIRNGAAIHQINWNADQSRILTLTRKRFPTILWHDDKL